MKRDPGRQLEELRAVVGQATARVPGVSAWSVGMHVEHLCLAMIGVCRSLLASRPPVPPSRFDVLTWAVFTTGRIPRGRGKAPEQALPREGTEPEELSEMLDESERWLARAATAEPDQWFRHFAFGPMGRDRSLHFLGIHNDHHLRIVRDILRVRNGGTRVPR